MKTLVNKPTMNRSYPTRKNRSKGFTLIELLVVILILAILAAMVVPKLIANTDKAKFAAAQGDLSTISKQLSIFRLDTGRYPTTEEGLAALTTQPSNADGWHGPYLEKDNTNDPWQHPYVYQYPGSRGDDSFLLESYGPSGQQGATDAIIESQ